MNIRKFGVTILRVAIRGARPELQDWGIAMLNEIAVIENDWAAFRWALGGAISLFQGFELPIKDASEVPKRLEDFEHKIRHKHVVGYLASLLVAAGFSYYFVIFPHLLMRAGCVLTILGSGFLAVQLRWNENQRRAAAPDSAGMSSLERYQAVLRCMREFHSGIWLLSRMVIFTPGPLLFGYGFRVAYPAVPKSCLAGLIAFLALDALAVPLNLKLSRKFQRQIEQLGALHKKLS
jgi:hypothetical protein